MTVAVVGDGRSAVGDGRSVVGDGRSVVGDGRSVVGDCGTVTFGHPPCGHVPHRHADNFLVPCLSWELHSLAMCSMPVTLNEKPLTLVHISQRPHEHCATSVLQSIHRRCRKWAHHAQICSCSSLSQHALALSANHVNAARPRELTRIRPSPSSGSA